MSAFQAECRRFESGLPLHRKPVGPRNTATHLEWPIVRPGGCCHFAALRIRFSSCTWRLGHRFGFRACRPAWGDVHHDNPAQLAGGTEHQRQGAAGDAVRRGGQGALRKLERLPANKFLRHDCLGGYGLLDLLPISGRSGSLRRAANNGGACKDDPAAKEERSLLRNSARNLPIRWSGWHSLIRTPRRTVSDSDDNGPGISSGRCRRFLRLISDRSLTCSAWGRTVVSVKRLWGVPDRDAPDSGRRPVFAG